MLLDKTPELVRSSSQGQSGKGQSSSGRELSQVSSFKGRLHRQKGVQYRPLPAPALARQKPGSAPARKSSQGYTTGQQDALLVPCFTDVAATPGGGVRRQFLRDSYGPGVKRQFLKVLLSDTDLTSLESQPPHL